MPRVSQPGARGARHKSQKRDGGAVTLARASWVAVGGREPPLSETIHLPGSGLGLLHISGFITLPCSPGGCYFPHFPAPNTGVTCPGSQRRVCGAGHSPCLQSSFLWESGPLGSVPTWHPAPPPSCDPLPALGTDSDAVTQSSSPLARHHGCLLTLPGPCRVAAWSERDPLG